MEPEIAYGTVSDLPELFERFVHAPGSFLIIEVPEYEPACVQFTEAADDSILIEYPLFTPEQIERESAARRGFSGVGLVARECEEASARFLDANMPRDAAGAAIKVQRILEAIFGVDSETQRRFTGGDGLTIVFSRSDPSQGAPQ